MELAATLKKYLLIACLATVTTFTASAQHGNQPGERPAVQLPAIKKDSLLRPWQWRQYLQAVSDSANGGSIIYKAYPSHSRHPATHSWEATPPFRWNDITSITAIALLGYFMSR